MSDNDFMLSDRIKLPYEQRWNGGKQRPCSRKGCLALATWYTGMQTTTRIDKFSRLAFPSYQCDVHAQSIPEGLPAKSPGPGASAAAEPACSRPDETLPESPD